jgi:hypothetical protein
MMDSVNLEEGLHAIERRIKELASSSGTRFLGLPRSVQLNSAVLGHARETIVREYLARYLCTVPDELKYKT